MGENPSEQKAHASCTVERKGQTVGNEYCHRIRLSTCSPVYQGTNSHTAPFRSQLSKNMYLEAQRIQRKSWNDSRHCP